MSSTRFVAPALESKSLVDQQDLNTGRVEGVGLTDDLVMGQGRAGGLEDLSGVSAGNGQAPFEGSLVSLRLILDNLVGTDDHDHVLGTKGDTTDLGSRKITMGHLSVLGHGTHGGEEVIGGGTDGTAELSLLGGVLLGQDLATDVVVRVLAHQVVDESNLLQGGAVGNVD